jgi:hypothetical protein
MENGLENEGRGLSTGTSLAVPGVKTIASKLGFGAVLLQLVACGAASTDELTDGGESAAEVSQALNETAMDRPMAAAISRNLAGSSQKQIWVFACDTNNKMRRRVGTEHGVFSGSWITVASSQSCASPPSVARWGPLLDEPDHHDILLVYWRDLNNNLIEVMYKEDGTTSTTNLSEHTGFGPIAGSPVVAASISALGAYRRVSIAVVKAGASRELYTLDYYQGAWQPPKPVLMDTGATATVMAGTSIVACSLDYDYLSIQLNLGSHFVFKRGLWSHNYSAYAWTAGAPNSVPKGVLGMIDSGDFNGRCATDFCAVARDPATNRPVVADLTVGGNITSRFTFPPGSQGGFPPPFQPPLASSVATRRAFLEPFLDQRPLALANGHVGWLSVTGRTIDSNVGSNIVSQPFPVEYVFGQFLYTVGPSNTLYYFKETNGVLTENSLGLNVAP